MGVLEKFAQKERYRDLDGEKAKLRALPGGDDALGYESTIATEDLNIDALWGLFHQAKRRYDLDHAVTGEALDCLAINLRRENRSGKIVGWRKDTIEVLLRKYFDKQSTPTGRRAYLLEAMKVRDEATTNTYRVLGLRRRYQRWLISALAVVGLAFIVMLAQNSNVAGQQSRRKSHARGPTRSVCNPATDVALSSDTADVSTGQESTTSMPVVALSVAQERQCLRSALGHGWVVWASAFAGAVGAIASALRRTSPDKDDTKRIPEVLASYLATFSRVLLGAFAGITFYLAYRSGAIILANLEPTTVAILGSFGFGFTERFFVIGEKSEKPVADPKPDASSNEDADTSDESTTATNPSPQTPQPAPTGNAGTGGAAGEDSP